MHLDALVRVGVRYFEFNSEPDLDSEWKGGRVPANGLDLVVDHAIVNMETILERGGMPAVPAVSNGSRWDLVGRIVARGRKDLFSGPVWQAIHSYAQNRPLDYPYDIGNQEGAAYTPRFYQALAAETWGEDAWRGRSLADVNRLRAERRNPGATIMDDHACWLAYERFDAVNRRHLGRSIPILATECGYLVGEDSDPRYPATTPDLHMAQTLEACRVMMGVSKRFAAAPPYFFCAAFWLMGNDLLGNSSAWCEPHAWYSERWPGKRLPIVHALKAEPKQVRRWQGSTPVGARSMLRGAILHAGDRRNLVLEKGGEVAARAMLDANSRYVMPRSAARQLHVARGGHQRLAADQPRPGPRGGYPQPRPQRDCAGDEQRARCAGACAGRGRSRDVAAPQRRRRVGDDGTRRRRFSLRGPAAGRLQCARAGRQQDRRHRARRPRRVRG